MSGGGGSTTNRNEPWSGQSAYLSDMYGQAQNLYNQGPMQFYPERLTALPSQTQLQGEDLAELIARGGQSTLAGAAVPAMQFQLGGPANLANNPYIAGATQAALRPLYTQTQGLLQQARRGATGAGQLDSSRQAILEQGVIGDYLTKAGDISSSMYNQAYSDALKTQTAALSQLPTALSSIMAPSQSLMQLGNIETARQQQAINDARARFEFEQKAPYQALQNYSQIAGQNILPGTQTQTAGDPLLDPAGTLVGGAGGYAIGSGMAGTLAGLGTIGGPAGMIGGAIIGGLLAG
tara:strand:- start:2280 stop:3158 length:879 start_codon:yes stop_codon:yes gene_type:complete